MEQREAEGEGRAKGKQKRKGKADKEWQALRSDMLLLRDRLLPHIPLTVCLKQYCLALLAAESMFHTLVFVIWVSYVRLLVCFL